MNKQELIKVAQINGHFAAMSKTDFLSFNAPDGYWQDENRYAYDCKFFSKGILSFWKKTGRVTFKKTK